MFNLDQLDNGVRLLTSDHAEAQSATALVMFGVGSRFEQANQCGIAHFAEHMFFKGTDKRPTARDISQEIDGIGGEFNAFTGKEYTGYYVKCAAEHLELAVDVLADQMLGSKFDGEEIDREKGVILEEMNMYRDTPMRYVGNIYDDLLYGNQPLGWDIVGTEDVIRGANRELFTSFLDRWYTGNRCVIGLGGRVSDGAKDLTRELFSNMRQPNEGTRVDAKWEQTSPQVKLFNKESEQAHLVIGLRAPGVLSEDKQAISVFNAILGGGMSSRLFVEIRERLGLCYYVRSFHDAYTDTGSFAVSAGLDTGRIDMAITAIIDEMWKFLAEPPAEAEFRKAKNYLKGRFVLGIEDPRGLIMYGVRKEAVEGGFTEPAEALAKIEAVTMDNVMRVARQILNPDLLNLAIVGPFEDQARFEKLLVAPAVAV
ncbi:MAG: insulinase family protein [Thermoleophilia bacterium]|nr:insulinase family protein [Thermoleophilia bacterium]